MMNNVNINVEITDSNDSTKVASYTIKTDESGFYAVRMDSKEVDEDGNVSDSGYSFKNSHTVTLTVEPSSHDYIAITSAATGIYYRTVNEHNFSGYTCSVSVNNYYANAVCVRNCLVKKSA